MTFCINIPATFCFDVYAESEEEALVEARRLLSSRDPIDNGKVRAGFEEAFIAVAGADLGFPDLEVEEVLL